MKKLSKITTVQLLEHCKVDSKQLSFKDLTSKYRLTYNSWRAMKQRVKDQCIVLDQRLKDFRSFLRWRGPRTAKDYSLDRIDCKGPYSVENTRWADKSTQTLNRSNAVRITHGGETLPLKAWASRLGVSPDVLYKRRSERWTDDEIITGKRSNARISSSYPWPRGKEESWERLYREEKEEDESRERFYYRICMEQRKRYMKELEPYKENMETPPQELRDRFTSAQQNLPLAEEKYRAALKQKTETRYNELFLSPSCGEYPGTRRTADWDGDEEYQDEDEPGRDD